MLLKLDLHLHTVHSGDSFITLSEAIRCAKRRGLDGFAVTDHDAVMAPEKIPEEGGVIIIPGVEVSSRDGHLLGLGVSEPVKRGLSASETVDEIHALGGLAVAAHPFDWPFRSSLSGRTLQGLKLDAVETVNSMAPFFKRSGRRARALASSLGLPQTGGSDAHIADSVGLAYTLVEVESRGVKGVLRGVRGGRTEAFGRGASLLSRVKKMFYQMGGGGV